MTEFLEKLARRAPQRPLWQGNGENRDLTPGNEKNDDPAKMMHSIPDFVSRDATITQEFFQYLERKSPIIKIKS
jgi:hypothetical protein